MNVLVDTSIWSLVLRKETPQNHVFVLEMSELINESRVRIIGPIRQELLSGIKSAGQFKEIKSYLSGFHDIPLETSDFEKAAEFSNTCRRSGIQGSNSDFLIYAVAYLHNLEIFTTDNDFSGFQKYVPVNLYSIRTHK
jgi:predicted nucleic acid-binding protein